MYSVARVSGWARIWLLLLPVWLIYAAFVIPPPWEQGYSRSSKYLIYDESERPSVEARIADDVRRICVAGSETVTTDELTPAPGPEPSFFDYINNRDGYSPAVEKWKKEKRQVALGLKTVFPKPGEHYIFLKDAGLPSQSLTFSCQNQAKVRGAWLYAVAVAVGIPILALAFILVFLGSLPRVTSVGRATKQWILDGFREDDRTSGRPPIDQRRETALDPTEPGPSGDPGEAVKSRTRFSKLGQMAAAFLGAWLLSFHEVEGQKNVILAAAEAAPVAIFCAVLAAAFMRADNRSPYKEWCLSAIILGVLAYGRAFGRLRDLGRSLEEATASALFNGSGLLIMAGAVGFVLLSRMRSTKF